jgi:hypothetical protein
MECIEHNHRTQDRCTSFKQRRGIVHFLPKHTNEYRGKGNVNQCQQLAAAQSFLNLFLKKIFHVSFFRLYGFTVASLRDPCAAVIA